MVVIEQIVNGLSLGGLYALVAAGIALIAGVLGLVNFAHGEFFMLASYLFFGLYVIVKLPYLLTAVITMALMGVFGAVFEILLIRPVVHRPWQTQLVATLGASVLFANVAVVAFGAHPKRAATPLVFKYLVAGSVSISYQRVLLILLTVVAFLLLHLFVHTTKLGKAMRAVSQNREACVNVGINVQLIAMVAFAIGSSLAGLAAVLAAPLTVITPTMGILLTVKAFAAIIMGGIGFVNGAVVSAFILGVAEALTIQYVSSAYVDAFSFVVMLAVLVFRPQGLFGKRVGI
jgi:branched-chain amino acid transport system permease protein